MGDDVGAVAGGSGQSDGFETVLVRAAVVHLTQREDRWVHILGQHIGVAAVHPVVEVVPGAAVPQRGAHHTGEQRHRVRGQEPAGLGHQGELPPPVAEDVVDDGADRLDAGHRLAVVDRESAADVDHPGAHVEGALDVVDQFECLAQRGPIGLDGRALATDVETEARESNSSREDVLDDQVRLAR